MINSVLKEFKQWLVSAFGKDEKKELKNKFFSVFTAKNLAIFLGLAVIGFGVATIVLAIQKDALKSELDDAREKLDLMENELRRTTTIGPQTTSTSNTNESSSSSIPEEPSTPTTSGSSTLVSSPSINTPGITTEDPGHEKVKLYTCESKGSKTAIINR